MWWREKRSCLNCAVRRNAQKIAATVLSILGDKQKTEKIHARLYALKNTLGIPAPAAGGGKISSFLG
jgi:hypothetical protein